jgi:ATP-dependent helicase/nuclease subunit B
MLEVITCATLQHKRHFLDELKPDTCTWVVSDLQSKWNLQRKWLDENGVLEGASVLRATELWRLLGFRLLPDYQVLTAELAQTVFWSWLEPLALPWAKTAQSVPVLLKHMQLWMAIFADPKYVDIMPQWFLEHQASYVRWGHIFEVCARFWQRCQSEQMVVAEWLPGLLLAQDLSSANLGQKKLVFDLGPRVSLAEMQLIKELAQVYDVVLICPSPEWAGLVHNALKAYTDLTQLAAAESWQPQPQSHLAFGRFSTQLAEVKDAVARVRQWLDAGIPIDQIALVAPDIEFYWPALQLYLREEGIPAAKSKTARLGSFLSLAQWLAQLRTALQQVHRDDLELTFFACREPALSFDDFKVLFSHVFDPSDLKRAEVLFANLRPPNATERLNIKEFLAWALAHWPSGASSEALEAFLKCVGREAPELLKLKPQDWIGYFEGLLARREVTLESAATQGLACVSLSSTDWIQATHAVVLNLAEESLRSVDVSPMSASDAQQILSDTGFAVGGTDHQEQEFEFLWLLYRPWQQLHLTFAASDFQGKVLTPSKFWLWLSLANGELKRMPQAPQSTRWDQIQRSDVDQILSVREFSAQRQAALKAALDRDAGRSVLSAWGQIPSLSLSASSLESYKQCPFKFAAQRRLRLRDDPALDLDLDRRTRGRLLHALAEKLVTEPMRWEWSDDELLQLIETVRSTEDVRMGEERLWPVVQRQHLQLARQFLAFEQSWREKHPATKTVGTELKFDCYWDVEKSVPTAEVTNIKLSGRIDRLDQDPEGRYALIDYKASSGSLRNWKSWLDNFDIQMALYSLLIEQGVAGVAAGPVVAANYFVIKEGTRHKGFHLQEDSPQLYSMEPKPRNLLNEKDKQQLFNDLCQSLNEVVAAIAQGEFNPKPVDPRECNSCSWSQLCRSSHLN